MSILKHRVFGAVLASLVVGHAHAQTNSGISLLPPASGLACLDTGGAGKPAYPERELALKNWAVVRVRLSFVAPDAPPRVETTFNTGSDEFDRVVTSFVKGYRLPCMVAGSAAVRAVQEFQFDPGDGRKVIYGALRDDQPKAEAALCVTGMRPPEYPLAIARPEGTVVVEMKFVDGSSAPQAKVLFDGGSAVLAEATLEAVAEYRMPCLAAGAKPVSAMQFFTFLREESRRYALKDLELRQFVAFVDNLDQYRVRFDFSTMGCPFDVRLQLFRPHLANRVGEVGLADPNRREFIEWLRLVSLKLPRGAAHQVIGQSTTISVPCAILDLT